MAQRFRISLNLPSDFQGEQLEANWSEMFIGIPRDRDWEVEVEDENQLEELLTDFLALHAPLLCEVSGVESFEQIPGLDALIQIQELDPEDGKPDSSTKAP